MEWCWCEFCIGTLKFIYFWDSSTVRFLNLNLLFLVALIIANSTINQKMLKLHAVLVLACGCILLSHPSSPICVCVFSQQKKNAKANARRIYV